MYTFEPDQKWSSSPSDLAPNSSHVIIRFSYVRTQLLYKNNKPGNIILVSKRYHPPTICFGEQIKTLSHRANVGISEIKVVQCLRLRGQCMMYACMIFISTLESKLYQIIHFRLLFISYKFVKKAFW